MVTFSVGLASCSFVGPDYLPPKAILAGQFALAESSAISDVAFEKWWESFDDPLLNVYMQRGMSQSLDIRVARERIAEAQALYRAAGGGGVPAAQLSGDARLNSTLTLANGTLDVRSLGTLDANFVFDLFGGTARGVEAAGANFDAAVLNVWVTRLAFQSELIAAYIDARFFQTVIAITNEGIVNRRRTLQLVEVQLTVNDVTTLDVTRAEAELSLVQATLPAQKIGFESNAVRLASLLNVPAQAVIAEMTRSTTGIPVPSRAFDAGVPVSLLRNRPDIMVAERRLAASMAAVGVNEAALYPSLSLGGVIRVDTDNALQLGPTLAIPLLGRPRLLANRDAAVSRARQAELNWHLTVQDAVFEVEQTLSRAKNRREEMTALSRASQNFRKLAQLLQDTYESRSSTLLELLNAEDDMTNSASSLAQSKRAYAIALAELAISTGRGTRAQDD